jgi:heme-degrading monooxygenase HmoA
MIAVIFELEPHEGCAEEYFGIAADLAPRLDDIDGFISIERFESLSAPGRFLSLSFWRDAAAVAVWRNALAHRRAQAIGRARILSDYRLRVAEVVRDYGLRRRDAAPTDSRMEHN